MMEKIKLSFFDTFAYLFPGVLVLIAIIVVLDTDIESVKEIPNAFKNLTTSQIVIALFVSYIIGIVCNFFGHKLYQVAKFIWKKEVLSQKDYHLTDTEIHVLIRELSPRNYSYLESWLGLSNMSHNTALALFFFLIVGIIKVFQVDFKGIIDWALLIAFCFISMIIFLKRSIRFNNYYKAERVATIEKLSLIEKAGKNV